jgi:DNA-binding beta-propeller fold protein YncE
MKFTVCLWITFVVCGGPVGAESLTIETVAGTGSPESNGSAGQATSINVGDPFGVEIGPDGSLYVTEVRNHRVLRVDLASGELSTVAGCGRRGYSGDGGPATEAELNEPYEVRFDHGGNMFFVEMQNHIVRRVDAKSKVITTVVGTGRKGFGGDGGPATDASLNQPHSIALDGSDALYIADIGNHRIRRVDPTTGVIESIAGSSERRLPHDGQTARRNPILGPRALFIRSDILWIALREGHSIWRMDLSDGILHHVAGTGKAGFAGDGAGADEATFNGPKGIALDADGNVIVADTENHAIRKIDAASGIITTIAGGRRLRDSGVADGGAATAAGLNRPHGVCVGPNGAIYIGDTLNHRVCRVHRSATE